MTPSAEAVWCMWFLLRHEQTGYEALLWDLQPPFPWRPHCDSTLIKNPNIDHFFPLCFPRIVTGRGAPVRIWADPGLAFSFPLVTIFFWRADIFCFVKFLENWGAGQTFQNRNQWDGALCYFENDNACHWKREKHGKYKFWLGNYCMEQGDGGVGVDFFGFLSSG